jgi:hypothetical protein
MKSFIEIIYLIKWYNKFYLNKLNFEKLKILNFIFLLKL